MDRNQGASSVIKRHRDEDDRAGRLRDDLAQSIAG